MKLKLLSIAALSLVMTACATGRSPVSPGMVVTAVSGSESVTSNKLGSLSGTACATNVLGLFAFGDASTQAAAKKGGLSSVSHVDYKTNSVLGVYATSCTVVHGD